MNRSNGCDDSLRKLPIMPRHRHGAAEPGRVHYPNRCGLWYAPGDIYLRVVLSNIGTLGDINPLIAIALELKASRACSCDGAAGGV